MAATAFMRGHLVVSADGHTWQYADTREPADDSRPCIKCGEFPTSEGHDACLGVLPGVSAACCGHGAEEGYQMEHSHLESNGYTGGANGSLDSRGV